MKRLGYCPPLLISLLFIGFWLTGPVQAAGPPLSLERYWQKVEDTQTFVAGLSETPSEAERAQLLTMAEQWAQISQVTLPDGSLVAVDHSFLTAQLRANPPDLARLKELLAALLAARRRWPASKHTPADLKLLAPILTHSEFQWRPEQSSPLAELWRRLLIYLWEHLAPYLPDQALISLEGSFFNYLLTGLGVLALILVLFFTLRELLAGLVSDIAVAPEAGAGDEVLTADAALKRAQGLSSAGDYRAAVRYLYLSSLLLLDERGLLRYNRSQTNREYLRSVAHLPKLAAVLRDVIEVFDRVWYGYQPLDETAYSQYAARVAELRRQK